jgi:hypothetical protein
MDGGDDDVKPEELDEDAINSDLDDPDEGLNDEEDEDEGMGHIMLCMYDKVQRVKNKWYVPLSLFPFSPLPVSAKSHPHLSSLLYSVLPRNGETLGVDGTATTIYTHIRGNLNCGWSQAGVRPTLRDL